MTLNGPLYTSPASPSLGALAQPSSQTLDTSPAFYSRTSRAVVDCCGHEVGVPDFHSAVDMLNSRLKLGLGSVDCHAFSFMLTALANSRRFAGEIHIDPVQGENSAAHSCHSVVLAHEIFRRSGLLASDRFTPEIDSVRRSVAIGCLIHDMGEILGELSSLAQRNANRSIEELPDIEREIFRITLTEAYRAASATPLDPSTFYSFVRSFRHDAKLSEKGIAGTTPEQVARVLQHYSERQQSTPVGPDITAAVGTALRLYDMAELKKSVSDNQSIFIGNAVKVVEHLQGLRHFMRFARVDSNRRRQHLFSPETHADLLGDSAKPASTKGVISLQFISSRRFLSNVKYIEKELPHLFSSASTPDERTLAGALRDAAYQSQIEWFSISRSFIDRTSTQEMPGLVALQGQLAQADTPEDRSDILSGIEHILKVQLNKDRTLFIRSCRGSAEEQTSHPHLLPCESRTRIERLYSEALRVGFVPTSETPLLLLDAVPSQLSGFLTPRPEREAPLPPRADAFDGLSMPPPQA